MQPAPQAENHSSATAVRGFPNGIDAPSVMPQPLPGQYSAGSTYSPELSASTTPDVSYEAKTDSAPDSSDDMAPSVGQPLGSGPVYTEPKVNTPTHQPESDEPMPVVRVLSVRGVEYGMMTIALWVAATTAAWIALNFLNGSGNFDNVVVPVSSLVICLPVFGLLFLRLKRAELAEPSLKLDPSKRRWSQSTQFLAFIGLLINFIYFVYVLLQHASGGKGPTIGKSLLSLAVVTVIAGGILAYYWHDEHRARKG